MKITLFIILTFITTSCGQQPRAVPVSGTPLVEPSTQDVSVENLVGRRIDDLLVLVFPSNMNAERWTDLFKMASRFSQMRTRNRILLASQAADTEEELTTNLEAIETTLLDLYTNHTVYLLSFGSYAGCTFTIDLKLQCQGPQSRMADFPIFNPDFRIVSTHRNGREISAALEIRISSAQFNVTLQLVPETNQGEVVYKGQAIVSENSFFSRQEIHMPHYPYGYAEMRLSPL